MNIRDYLYTLNLTEGETKRSNCPMCNGKLTFTATKDLGQIKYNCYKLDCKIRGYHHTDMTAEEVRKLMRSTPKPTQKEVLTMDIPEYVVTPSAEHTKFHRFVKRWGLQAHGLLYDVKDERVVFPIYHKGRMIDANGRAVGGKLPKWYRYTGAADYYIKGTGSTIIVVEDVVSADIAVLEVPHISSMAILGTSLTDKHIEKLGQYNQVIVALDPDAIKKTLEFKREIELWTGRDVHALKLDDDIKYRVQEDIERIKELYK